MFAFINKNDYEEVILSSEKEIFRSHDFNQCESTLCQVREEYRTIQMRRMLTKILYYTHCRTSTDIKPAVRGNHSSTQYTAMSSEREEQTSTIFDRFYRTMGTEVH